jgi:hypothetical protein
LPAIEVHDRVFASVKDEDAAMGIDADPGHLSEGETVRKHRPAMHDAVGRGNGADHMVGAGEHKARQQCDNGKQTHKDSLAKR